MKIVLMLKNIKNLFPYFLLIGLYFLFINLETSNNEKNKSIIMKKQLNDEKANREDQQQTRMSIPVIPYSK